MIERQRAHRVLAVGLLVLFGVIALVRHDPYTFLHGDGAFYANTVKSLAGDGSLDQGAYHPRSWLDHDLRWNRNIDQGWSNVSLGADGTWLPKHSFVLPLVSTPFYALFGLDGLLLFQVLMMAAILLAAFGIASALVPAGPAAVATLLVAAQPVFAEDVYAYNNDAFYTALLLGGAWAFARGRLLWSGALFGLACWAKLTNVLFVVPFGALLLWRRDWRALGRAAAVFSVPLVIFGACNWWLFGSPTTTSYDVILVRESGQLRTESVKERFSEPLLEGTKRVFGDDHEGLNGRAPLLWLAIPGALLAWAGRARWWGAAFAAVFAAFVILHAKYAYTYARFFLPVAALGVIPTAVLLDRAGRWRPSRAALVAVAGVGLLVAGWRALPPSGWRLSDHVEEAVVTQGTEPCDYFNNMRQKFECHTDGRHGHSFFWGRALGKDQCKFDGEARPMLWLHPPARAKARHMSWNHIPPGDSILIQYGLAETSRHDDVRLEVWINDKLVDLPPIEERGKLMEHEVEGPFAAGAYIELRVKTPPRDWRHLCLDAEVR